MNKDERNAMGRLSFCQEQAIAGFKESLAIGESFE
jgi:hypothetical protein